MSLLHILQHSLGADQHGHGSMYRNHFVTGEGSTDWPTCMEAVDRGLMIRRAGNELSGGDDIFIVTDAGKQFVRDKSPIPPATTRSARRYAAWLRAEWFAGSFGEWLKSPHADEPAQ